MDLTISILYYLTSAAAFCFAFVYFLHMFQLEGYHRDAFCRWIGDNLGGISAKLTFAFIAFILSCLPFEWCRIVSIFLYLLTILMFLPNKNAKKPLVYTARIKRLMLTLMLLFTLGVVLGILVPFTGFIPALLLLITSFIVILSDIINSPFEKAVKQHYINDAKKILARRSNLKIIGITGSYGKTSCKNYLTKLLSPKYNVLMTPASYNTPMGVVKTVREHLKNSHEIFVCEMGAKNVGDIKELCDLVHPHMGLISSVGPQHLESFKTIENVVSTKFELYDAIKDGNVYLNYDNEYIKNRPVGSNVVTFGMGSFDYKAENVTLSDRGTDFDIVHNGEAIHFSTRLLGSHNVMNLAGCIAIALDLGVDKDDVVMAVKRLETVEHRLQIIDGGNITIIDDAFNANPSGTKATLEVLSHFNGTKIIVTPGMIELGSRQSELNREFGRNCASVCDYIFLVGGRIADDVYAGVLETNFDNEKLLRFDTVQDAVDHARRWVQTDNRKFVLLENDLPDNY